MEEDVNICVTCLSTDRHLVPVHKITALLREIHFEELLESPGGVCWECRSILKNFYCYKNRAKIAQEILAHTTEHLNIKSLTTLSKTNILLDHTYTYDFVSTNNCVTKLEVEQDSIKEENGDLSHGNLDKTDDSLHDALVIVAKPEKYENIITYSDGDVIENKCNDNLIRKQENLSQDEKDENIETNEKFKKITVQHFEETNPNVIKPTRQNKDGGRITKSRLKKQISQKLRDIDDKVFKEKFEQVVLSEVEMIAARDERRNHPSFRKLPHICHGCVLGFRKEEKYRSHMKKKHDEKIGNLICEVCNVRFPHNLALNKHTRKHYVVYKCRLCNYKINDLRSAVNHCKLKHKADKPDSIHCSQCYFVAKNSQDLEEHVEKEHRFWCNDCGEKFKIKRNIIKHMTRTHGPKRPFKCHICKKGFKTKLQMESHLVKHDTDIAKSFLYCTACDIQFKNLSVYRSHMRNTANHSDGYICSECNKIFTAKSYLKQHYEFYHLKKSPYKCGICNKNFMSKWRLTNHQAAHLSTARPRKYSCDICNKSFFNSALLRFHRHIHSDERNYMCEDCGDSFKQPACLYRHTRLKHSGVKRKRKRDC